MVAKRRFLELIVAVVSLVARLRDLNTELMKGMAALKRRRPPSETLRRLDNQLAFAFLEKVVARTDEASPEDDKNVTPPATAGCGGLDAGGWRRRAAPRRPA